MGIRQTILILALAATTFAQDLATRADEFVSAYVKLNQFSGAVLVAKEGKPVFSKAYGMANYEWGVPNTIDTRFRLGSITKQFGAAAILKLEEMGKLKVTDKACDYLPACPETWKPITIHHLLTHTSGIPNVTAIPEYKRIKFLPTKYDEQYNAVKDRPLEFDPGTRFAYSNSGYIVLGQIIEKAAGQPWETFLATQIFIPAGMKNTRADVNTALIPRRASGYVSNGGNLRNAEFIDMRFPNVAGGMISTVEDLLAWDRALVDGKVLSQSSLNKMQTPDKANYGYGVIVGKDGDKQVISHSGGIDGFSTQLHRIPQDGIVIAVLANFEDSKAGEIRNGLLRLLKGETVELPRERKEIELDTATLDEYVGTYRFAPTFAIEIRREGKQLVTQATGQGVIPVYVEEKDVLFPKAMPATLRIQRENGKVTGLILDQGGRQMKATREAK